MLSLICCINVCSGKLRRQCIPFIFIPDLNRVVLQSQQPCYPFKTINLYAEYSQHFRRSHPVWHRNCHLAGILHNLAPVRKSMQTMMKEHKWWIKILLMMAVWYRILGRFQGAGFVWATMHKMELRWIRVPRVTRIVANLYIFAG